MSLLISCFCCSYKFIRTSSKETATATNMVVQTVSFLTASLSSSLYIYLGAFITNMNFCTNMLKYNVVIITSNMQTTWKFFSHILRWLHHQNTYRRRTLLQTILSLNVQDVAFCLNIHSLIHIHDIEMMRETSLLRGLWNFTPGTYYVYMNSVRNAIQFFFSITQID